MKIFEYSWIRAVLQLELLPQKPLTCFFFLSVYRDPPLRRPPPTWGKCRRCDESSRSLPVSYFPPVSDASARVRRRESTAIFSAWSMSRASDDPIPSPLLPRIYSQSWRAQALLHAWSKPIETRRWMPYGSKQVTHPCWWRAQRAEHWWSLTDRPCNQASQWFWVLN